MISIHSRDKERIPLIRLRDYLLAPIQVALTDRLVQQLRDDVGEEIRKTVVRALIIDVHGVDLMDSFIARSFRDIGLMAQIMGVQTIICGMDPAVATTLVEMGMELGAVSSALNLDCALTALDRKAKTDEVRDDELLKQLLGEVHSQGETVEQWMIDDEAAAPQLHVHPARPLGSGPVGNGPRGKHGP